MTAQPKKIVTELTEKLNDLVKMDLLNEIQLRSVKNDIDLVESDYERYVLLGMYCCIKKDINGIHSNFQKAQRIDNDLATIQAYAISLNNVDRQDSAYEMANFLLNTHDYKSLSTALTIYVDVLDFVNSKKTLERIEKLFPENNLFKHNVNKEFKTISPISDIFDELSIDKNTFPLLFKSVIGVIRDHLGHSDFRTSYSTRDIDGVSMFHVMWKLKDSRENVSKLRNVIDSLVVSMFDKVDTSKVIFRLEREIV
ncbi:MAG: hypothetical protein HRT54_15920 [Colwellia sp.]|nr:hypothetical protein [Colwellia sp.]